jgi:hypothetical protein
MFSKDWVFASICCGLNYIMYVCIINIETFHLIPRRLNICIVSSLGGLCRCVVTFCVDSVGALSLSVLIQYEDSPTEPRTTEPRMGLLSEWTQPRMGLNPESY